MDNTTKAWLKSLLQTVVSSIASAVITSNVLAFNGHNIDFKTLGEVALSNGLIALFNYLQKSPLP